MLACYPLLKMMEPRPAMWAGEANLKSIHCFLSGYFWALREHNLRKDDNHSQISFHDWVANRLGYYESTAGWANMILAYTLGFDSKNPEWGTFFKTSVTQEQHIASIKYFYELLEQFKQETENQG